MRKIYLFWILLVFIETIYSQNTNFASHSNVDELGQAVSINSKSYYYEKIAEGAIFNASGVFTYSSPDSANFVGVDQYGQVIFKKRFTKNIAHRIVSIEATNDKALAYVAYSWGCDIGPLKCNFVKLDTLGNEIFNQYLPALNGIGFSVTIVDFTQHLDSSFYLVSNSVLFHVSKIGDYVSQMSTGMTGISSIACMANGNLLVAGRINNINQLVELSTQNVIINQQNIAEPVKKIKISSTGLIVSLTESFCIRNYLPNLSPLLCSSVTVGSNIQVNDFDLKNDTVYATGFNNITNQMFYGTLNQNLQFAYQTLSNYKYITPVAITVNSSNRVSVFSNCSSTNKTYSRFTSIHQFPRYGNFYSKSDIGVTNVDLADFGQFNNSLFMGSIYNFSITVKNYGSDTIKGFKLNKYLADGSMCGRYRFNKFYHETILPFDSVTVTTAPFSDNPPSAAPVYSKSVCFFTSIPNSSNDVETTNDEFCKTFFLPVGIRENAGIENTLQIFPNPFSSQIQIQSEVEMKEIELFNSLGMSLKKIALNKKAAEIYTNDFQSGVYFVRITTEKGVLVKKLVRD